MPPWFPLHILSFVKYCTQHPNCPSPPLPLPPHLPKHRTKKYLADKVAPAPHRLIPHFLSSGTNNLHQPTATKNVTSPYFNPTSTLLRPLSRQGNSFFSLPGATTLIWDVSQRERQPSCAYFFVSYLFLWVHVCQWTLSFTSFLPRPTLFLSFPFPTHTHTSLLL